MADVSFQAYWKKSMKAALGEEAKAARIAATKGMKLGIDRLVGLVRGQVRAAGLGDRVANAVRGVAYPKSGVSLNAAGTVTSKAPHIMEAFEKGAVIRPIGRTRALWIPTADTPYGRGGGHIKPEVAIKRFGDPEIIKTPDGRLFAAFEVAASQDGLGWRRATVGRNRNQRRRSGRLVKARPAQLVIMYMLIPQAKLPKKLDVQAALAQAGRELPGLISISWPEAK